MNKRGQSEITAGIVITVGIIVIIALIVGSFYFLHSLAPWWESVSGEAELARADQNRQIAIKEAEAELESASLKKQTDILRAEGIAEANRIISSSLTKDYITWKWVEGLHDGSSEVIYVPTEANLPILEARG